MNRDGLRVLLPAIASIVAIAAAAFALEWFIVDINGAVDLSKITIDLREARACTVAGDCASVPMSIIIMIKGMSQNFFRTRMNIHSSLNKHDD